jgi:hypothetical protein
MGNFSRCPILKYRKAQEFLKNLNQLAKKKEQDAQTAPGTTAGNRAVIQCIPGQYNKRGSEFLAIQISLRHR